MPRQTNGPPRKDQILAAAERLFREKGYLAASIGDMGRAGGGGGASLYHHIGGKEELLWVIATRAADEFFAALQPIAASGEATPLKLRKAIIAHVGVITRNLDASAVYFNEWRHLKRKQRDQFARRRDEYEGMFRTLLGQGIREGIFAP